MLADVSTVAFAPSGYLLFLREGNLMAQPFDPDRGQSTGDVFPIAERIATVQNGYVPVTVSDNGMLVYWTGGGIGRGQVHSVAAVSCYPDGPTG